MQTLCTHVLCLLNWRNYTSEVATVKYKVLFENTEKLEDQRQRSAQKLVWAKYRNCTKIRPDLVPNLTAFPKHWKHKCCKIPRRNFNFNFKSTGCWWVSLWLLSAGSYSLRRIFVFLPFLNKQNLLDTINFEAALAGYLFKVKKIILVQNIAKVGFRAFATSKRLKMTLN